MYTITYRYWTPLSKPTTKEFYTLEAGEYWYNYYKNSMDACCVTKSW